MTLFNPNRNLHHRAFNKTTDNGYYSLEVPVASDNANVLYGQVSHFNLAVTGITVDIVISHGDPQKAWSTFHSRRSGHGHGKEVVALRTVVEVVVEMETRSPPSLGRRRSAFSASQLSSLGASQIQMLVREVN